VSDRASFMAAIRANPADDLPRLVYADWLDENGEGERAKAIRTSIVYEDETWGRHDMRYTAYEAELLALQREVFGDNPPQNVGGYWGFRRGFYEEIKCPFAYWVTHAPRILTDRPWWGGPGRFGEHGYPIARFNGDDTEFEAMGASLGDLRSNDEAARLLTQRWPEVATWELPPERSRFEQIMGDFMTRTVVGQYQDAIDEIDAFTSQHGTAPPPASD
jgi:uncharacterized protein (TIGR02996 family)